MAKVKKMAFGGMGSKVAATAKDAAQKAADAARQQSVAQAAAQKAAAQKTGMQSMGAAFEAQKAAAQKAAAQKAGTMTKPVTGGMGQAPRAGGAGFGNPQDQAKFAMVKSMLSGIPSKSAKDVAARQVDMQRPGPMTKGQGQGAMGMGVKAPANALRPMAKTDANAGRSGGAAVGKFMKSGGKVSSASSRADGIATKGKTKGRMI